MQPHGRPAAMADKYLQVKESTTAALPTRIRQRKKQRLVQTSRKMYLKQTLRNASFAEQKLPVLFQITVLLIQEPAPRQLACEKTED